MLNALFVGWKVDAIRSPLHECAIELVVSAVCSVDAEQR